MYIGALAVLEDLHNPDKLAQCAHSLRELMEKLSLAVEVPMKAHRDNLRAKVRELEDSYLRSRGQTICFTPAEEWKGGIDAHLQRFLARLGDFFDWFSTNYPRRRQEVHGVLMRLDCSERPLPQVLASLNVNAWQAKREYFQSVSHHGREAKEDEFRSWVNALERFLLERLVPRTFEDFAEIDALLGEERDANS